MRVNVPLSRSGRPSEEVAKEVVFRASAVLRASFRGALQVETKGRGNVVTDVDVRVEKEALDVLRREFPSFGIHAEESMPTRGDEPFTWILDPLDGTKNFATGIPHFAVNLALAYGNDILLAYTHDPLRDDLFRAAAGERTTVNGRRAHVTRNTAISQGIVGFDMPYNDALAQRALDIVRSLWPVQTVRVMGSAALGLAYASAGWIDLYYHLSLRPWDVAPGLLLVREAGGLVTDAHGAQATPFSGSYVASSSSVVGEFLERTAALPPHAGGEGA